MSESILIISYSMIPYCSSWGACQRMYYLSEYLQKNNYNVFHVHAKERYNGSFGHNISFHPIPIKLRYIDKDLNGPNINFKKEQANACKLSRFKKLLISTERILYNDINPSSGVMGELFVHSAKKTIIDLIKQNDIKKIIISGPPFSIFKLIHIINSKCKNREVILDYRDPWNLWNGGNRFTRRMERACLKEADMIVFTNKRLMTDVMKNFQIDGQKCVTILNGYSLGDWGQVLPQSKNEEKKLIISHIGNITLDKLGYRDLSCFLDAYELYSHKANTVIRIIGLNANDNVSHFNERFGESVEFIHNVPYHQSLRDMVGSDILLLLHTDFDSAKYIYPSKFFDYIRSSKPIWGISCKEDSAFIELIEKYKLGIASLNTIEGILKSLNYIHEKWLRNEINDLRQDDGIDIYEFSRDYQNSKYLDMLNRF